MTERARSYRDAPEAEVTTTEPAFTFGNLSSCSKCKAPTFTQTMTGSPICPRCIRDRGRS